VCSGTYQVPGNAFYQSPQFPNEAAFEQDMRAIFGGDCNNVTEKATENKITGTTVQSIIDGSCLKAEINYVLNHVQQLDAFPGTDGAACDVFGKQKGDWDVRMKSLIRIVFLDSLSRGDTGPSSSLLDVVRPDGRTTRDYVLQDLITVDGGPSPDTYYLWGCGDNEKDTGSAQDREDENGDGGVLDSVGDVLGWFAKLILILAAPGTAGAVASIASVLGITPAVVAELGVTAVLAGQYPETENHRLMIESTRFLNNQLIIQTLGPDNSSNTINAQKDVKTWLLKKFKYVAQHDFIEYNARPYQDYSLTALQNLGDFATDPDVKNGARMLLEYSAAKFAVGSNQGRASFRFDGG
jgi:hypothetical protein